MATLSLKKSRPIGAAPLENLSGQFVVMRQSRNEKAFRFTYIHPSRDLADSEARRLSESTGGERFLVLQIVDSFDWGQ
jgi:hypothetical protein